jgi:hypothetical protein
MHQNTLVRNAQVTPPHRLVGHSDFHGRDSAGFSPRTRPRTQVLDRTVDDNVDAPVAPGKIEKHQDAHSAQQSLWLRTIHCKVAAIRAAVIQPDFIH